MNDTVWTSILQTIISEENYDIEYEVAKEAIDHCPIENFFTDLLQHGCISGMVGSLIYYVDTNAFFRRHQQEILGYMVEQKHEFEILKLFEHDVTNKLAWFGFEFVASQLYFTCQRYLPDEDDGSAEEQP